MNGQKRVNLLITEELKRVTGCEVVKANLADAPIPPYPYISFSILSTDTRKGTYSTADGQKKYIPLSQAWSFTVQGEDDDETLEIAMKARDWLEEAGRILLGDNRIVVQKAGPIQNRDTLLTVGYEYRKGFDVVLSMQSLVEETGREIIESAGIKEERKDGI